MSGFGHIYANRIPRDGEQFYTDALAITAQTMQSTIDAQAARIAELEAALTDLIDQCHNCERELTEDLYRVDFAGESSSLMMARAALKKAKQ